jgi:hypothetical protein
MNWLRRWLRRPPVAPCPIRALVDRLAKQGWSPVMPFPIPDSCYYRTCGHLRLDTWARAYARRAEDIVQGVEDGRYGPADVDRLTVIMLHEAVTR